MWIDGSVAERFKAHAWKACNGATRSEVRILSLPPGFRRAVEKRRFSSRPREVKI